MEIIEFIQPARVQDLGLRVVDLGDRAVGFR